VGFRETKERTVKRKKHWSLIVEQTIVGGLGTKKRKKKRPKGFKLELISQNKST